MSINNINYLNFFSEKVNTSSLHDLKKVLLDGRAIRLESKQKLWNQEFDAIYAYGIERLAKEEPSQIPSLIDRISPKFPIEAKDAIKAASIGLGGFAGWLVGWVYNNSLSSLVLHEYGHAFAAKQIWAGIDPKVSSSALYWAKKGNWSNWFWGIRQGAPGNYTSFGPSGESTFFGKWLTPTERSLFIGSAGLGAELLLNTTIAGLGLLAMKKKHRVLGASLIGFSLISHSGAHSYIRRSPELLNSWREKGGDPPHIAKLLSEWLGISNVEAFRFLWYGYLFFPIFLFSCFVFLFMKPFNDIPDECVLMHLLAKGQANTALKRILIEVELEKATECEKMENLPQEEKEKLTLQLCETLMKKIKKNQETVHLFEETRRVLSKEVKGDQDFGFLSRLKEITSLVAFTAYQLRELELTGAFAKLFYYLSGTFLFAQTICATLDCIQTIKDLANEKFSGFAKCISVAKTGLSIVTLIVITPALFATEMATFAMPFFIVAAITRLILEGMNYFEMRRLAAIPI